MRSEATTVERYLDSLDPEWKGMIERLREILLENLPEGFEETMMYGMIGYAVPHSIYPDGYHVNPELPLPFINLAAQKNNISLYHMGLYGNENLERWFDQHYKEEVGKKPDMGKSCIRFKKEEDIPFKLLKELLQKITVDEYIRSYEETKKKIKKRE
jgi:hypothetical protein